MQRYDVRYQTRPQFVLETLTKDDNGEKRIDRFEPPFQPYCYVESRSEDDFESHLSNVVDDTGCEISYDAPDGYWKVETHNPWNIRDFDEAFDYKTFEADVPYTRRAMIDEGLQVDIPEPEDILYFDIEVDPRGEFPAPEEAKKRVLSIAAVGGDGEEYFLCYDDEEQIFREFFKDIVPQYFVLAGWNSTTFDWPYLMNRMSQMPFTFDEFRATQLDLQYLFMHINREERQSFALDAVGQDEVGMGKTMSEEDHEMGYEVLWHWFENDRDTLEEYNVEDCRITKAIDEKYQLTRILFRVGRRGYCRPSQLMYSTDQGQVNLAVGKACDGAILQANPDTVFPTKGRYKELHDFPGGEVLDPKPGKYTDVMTADFSGMYPAIIRDFNIGRRTWLDCETVESAVQEARDRWGDHVTEDDIIKPPGSFDEELKARGYFIDPEIKESELAVALGGIESLRKEFKAKKKAASKGSTEWHRRNNQDRGLKVLANSMFGVGASPYHRFYEPGMSENITVTGQNLTRECDEHGTNEMEDVETVIYGDTDSVMFALDVDHGNVETEGFAEFFSEFIEEVGPDNELDLDRDDLEHAYETITVARKVSEDLNEFVVEYVRTEFNSPGNYMEMDLDDVWLTYLITDKKKKYAGEVIYDDGPCAYRKIKGFRCVKANTSDAIVKFQKELIDAKLHDNETTSIVNLFREDLFNGKYDWQMVQHTRLNKMPSDYDTLMAHARAARMIIEREDDKGAVRTGDKIAYLKYDDPPEKVMPVDEGIKDFRPNEGYCEECDEVIYGDHDHETDDGPLLRRSYYSYLWDARFKPTMDLLQVNRFNQTGLGDFVAA